MSSDNPYQAPVITTVKQKPTSFPKGEYGGLGRLNYFLISFGFGIVNNLIQYFGAENGMPELVIATGVIGLIVGIPLMVLRLKNLGYSGWWVLAMIVPFLNILVAVRIMACPEGYADHQKLDQAAKIIIGLFLGLIVLIFGLAILAAVLGA